MALQVSDTEIWLISIQFLQPKILSFKAQEGIQLLKEVHHSAHGELGYQSKLFLRSLSSWDTRGLTQMCILSSIISYKISLLNYEPFLPPPKRL